MKFRQKVFGAVLCLWALALAAGVEASVTIKGKPLDEIDDVVSTATDGGKAEMKKYSLGVIANKMNNFGDIEKHFYVGQIATDGSASDTHDNKLTGTTHPIDAASGMHVAASSLTNKNGRAVLWCEYSVDTTNGVLTLWPTASFVNKDGEITGARDISLTAAHDKDGAAFDQDIEGGIFLPGDKNEYFAIAMLKNAHIKDSGTLCSANIFIVGMNLKDGDVNLIDTGVVIEKDMNQGYSPVSVAVGDFTGSGTTDQIAFTTASTTGIELTVCKLEKDSGGKISSKVVKTETVCTYTGRMKEGVKGRSDYYPSAETVAGDFDGDGKTEIAVVFKDDADEKDPYVFGRINLTVYKWDNNSGSFASATQQTSVNNVGSHQDQYEDSKWWVNFLGLKAVRCDFNGEGKDGIVVLLLAHQKCDEDLESYGHHYYDQVFPYFIYWGCEQGTIQPYQLSGKCFDGCGINHGPLGEHGSGKYLFGDNDQEKGGVFYYRRNGAEEGNPMHGGYPYVDRTFTLASGPFTGQLGTFKMIDDLAVSWSGKRDEDLRGDKGHAYVFKMKHNDAGKIMGVESGVEIVTVDNTKPENKMAIVAADFLGEGVELEAPVHLKVEGDRTYAAILQTPPYHVDNIPVPWDSDPTTPKLTNFTYSSGLKTAYIHESSSETGQDVNFDMKGSAETIEAVGIGGETGADLIIKAASYAVKGSGPVIQDLMDKVDTTKSEADKSSIKMMLTDEVETSTSDSVMYYSTNVHVWRYPIREPAPAWLFENPIEPVDGEVEVSGDKFLTFTMADDPVFHVSAGLEDESYQPLHEEGNLFSYPTNLAQIPGYGNRQLTLTGESSITYSPGDYTRTITVTQEASSETTETREVKYGTISNIIGTVQVLSGNASANALSGERGNSSTFTKSYSTTDTLTTSFPNPEGGDYANVTFTTDLQAYADEAGILTLGFAVTDFGNTARLWQSSIYNEEPDPALYLPFKYYFDGDEVIARDDEMVATKMRGVRFYIPGTDSYSGSTLYAGGKYRIDIPIYNASFVAPDGSVKVALSFRDKGGSEKTPIGTQSVTISGWEAGRESNKAIVSFDWTVPNDLKGAKELVVEIDPDDDIDEIHEGWDPEAPGGNNFGYFPFSVMTAEANRGGLKEPRDSNSLKVTIGGMSLEDFLAYAARQSKPFDAQFEITYTGADSAVSSLAANAAAPAYISLVELNLMGSNDEVLESFSRQVGVIEKGETFTFKFLVKPEVWRLGRALEAVFYTNNGVIRQRTAKGSGSSGSSGGCDAGSSVLGLGILLPALLIRRKAR